MKTETLAIQEAQRRYAEMPSLAQPHTLDADKLETCGMVLLPAQNARPQLSAVSCAVDYAHVLAWQGKTLEAKQLVAYATHRNTQAKQVVEAEYSDHPMFYSRLSQTNINAVYLPYYGIAEALPLDRPTAPVFQASAYEALQKVALNPLLAYKPREEEHKTKDRIELSQAIGPLVVLQVFNRVLSEMPDIGFTVLPANIRENHRTGTVNSPYSLDKYGAFTSKLVFRDHTMLPISVFVQDRPHHAKEPHPKIAEICWAKGDIQPYDLRAAAVAMGQEVAGEPLAATQQELITHITGHVLRSVSEMEPIGESLYGATNQRVEHSKQAYDTLRRLADTSAA